MHPVRLIGLLITTAACGPASRVPAGGGGPGPAPSATVTFAAGTTQYRGVSHLRLEQTIEGQAQVNDFQTIYFTTIELSPEPTGRLRAVLLLDSILPASASLLTEGERERARGTRFTGTLTADGQLLDFTGGDSLPTGRLQQLATAVRQFFPRLLPRGAEPGQEWIDTTETKTSSAGVGMTVHSVNTHRVTGWSEYGGRRALQLQTSAAYTLSGSGQQGGQAFTLEGTGVRSSDQFLSTDGRYLGQRASDSATVEVLLTGLGLTIPSRQIRTDTLRAIP